MNRANEARDMTKDWACWQKSINGAILLIGHIDKAGGKQSRI